MVLLLCPLLKDESPRVTLAKRNTGKDSVKTTVGGGRENEGKLLIPCTQYW